MNRFLQALFLSDCAYINGVRASGQDLIAFAKRYTKGKAILLSQLTIEKRGRLNMYLEAE